MIIVTHLRSADELATLSILRMRMLVTKSVSRV